VEQYLTLCDNKTFDGEDFWECWDGSVPPMFTLVQGSREVASRRLLMTGVELKNNQRGEYVCDEYYSGIFSEKQIQEKFKRVNKNNEITFKLAYVRDPEIVNVLKAEDGFRLQLAALIEFGFPKFDRSQRPFIFDIAV
jgi:hypothetical protein